MHIELTIRSDSAAEFAEVTQALAGRHVPAGRPGELPWCARCDAFVPTAAEPCPGVQAEEPAAQEAPSIHGPTARDAVAGMLFRTGWDDTAVELATGKLTPAEAAGRLRRGVASWKGAPERPDDATCIAALEALAAREQVRALPLDSAAKGTCPRVLDTDPSIECEGGHAPGEPHRNGELRWGDLAAAPAAPNLGASEVPPRDMDEPDTRSLEQLEVEAKDADRTSRPALAQRIRAYARGIGEGMRRARAEAESRVAVPSQAAPVSLAAGLTGLAAGGAP